MIADIPGLEEILNNLEIDEGDIDDDFIKSVKRLAGEGDPNSCFFIGMLHYYGAFVEKSLNEAIRYLEKAADLGNCQAQVYLGQIFIEDCCEPDYRNAIKYYEMASEQGDPVANFELGTMYKYGISVEKSEEKARMYLEKSLDVGFGPAGVMMNEDIWEMIKDYCFNSTKQEADHGDSVSQEEVADMYLRGEGVEKSEEMAIEYYEKAIENGSYTAHRELGKINLEKSADHYQKAAEHGDCYSARCLGFMFKDGLGVKKSESEAARYFEIGAEQDDPESMYQLAMFAFHPDGTHEVTERTVELLRSAADRRHRNALYTLVRMYQNGIGVPVDRLKAMEYRMIISDMGGAGLHSAPVRVL